MVMPGIIFSFVVCYRNCKVSHVSLSLNLASLCPFISTPDSCHQVESSEDLGSDAASEDLDKERIDRKLLGKLTNLWGIENTNGVQSNEG